MMLSDSTRRGLRTLYQATLTGLVTIPIVLAAIPQKVLDDNLGLATVIASILGVLAVVSKIINTLEDSGVIPPVLKNATVTGPETPGGTPEATEQAVELPYPKG